jgi:hypothetical protein
MEAIKVTSNCPIPRGGTLKEVRHYPDGRTKTIVKRNFQGRWKNWDEWADSDEVPFD